MNEGQTIEIVDLLEDVICELSGSYVTGTGKDGIPKRLFQINDYLSKKKTDARECIFTDDQLKLIAGNKKAKAIIDNVFNVYNQRIELGRQLQSRIYGCYSQNIPINGDIERANFEITAYERLNNLNQEHFNHMADRAGCRCDEYIKIIENYVNGLNTVYLKELQDNIDEFVKAHNANTIIKPELIGKYFGSMESNRIGSNIKKQEVVNPIYKEYGLFLDKMDKSTITAQNKELIPNKYLAYKLQYLSAKTKIIDVVNMCMKDIEVDNSGKKISSKTKKKNDSIIKKSLIDIKEISSEYKDIIKAMKMQNREDAKIIKKSRKKQKMLNTGVTKTEELKACGITIEPVLSEEQLVKKFITDSLCVPPAYVTNPIAYEAIYDYIQCFKETNHQGEDFDTNNFSTIRQGLAFFEMHDGIKFEYDRKGAIKLKQAIEIKIDDGQVNVIREYEDSTDTEKFAIKPSKKMPKVFVHRDCRTYDNSTNIEMSRIYIRAKLAENSKVEEESCRNIYKRDMANMHLVYKNNEKKPLDLSITSEDIATLDGAVRTTYALAESSRQTTIKAIVNSRITEAKERSKMNKARGIKTKVPKESEVFAQVQREVGECAIKRKVQESKYKTGFMKYSQYSNIDI